MFLSKTNVTKALFSAAVAMSLTSVATAQGGLGNLGNILTNPGYSVIFQPPTLPPVEYRFNEYNRSIGNSWLGGSVHAYAQILRQKNGTYELGMASAEFSATARVLQQSSEVVEIIGNATNVMNGGVQQRNGLFRIELLGYPIVNSTFANSSTFASAGQQFNLIPGGVSVSVPVGPIAITLTGNAGCGYNRSANWLLPAATASVGLNATTSAHAFANAQVGFGVPGFGIGVGVQGNILQQTLSGNVNANAVWGLSGSMSYTLQPIVLTLYAWAQALYTWTTNLCSWSAGQVTLNLI